MVPTIDVEDMSDKLDAAVSAAAKHIAEDYLEHNDYCRTGRVDGWQYSHCTCKDAFEKEIREILIARIYIPMMEIDRESAA